ncbi:hypothetical protein ACQ4PT_042158 [Festuca glaucescens]
MPFVLPSFGAYGNVEMLSYLTTNLGFLSSRSGVAGDENDQEMETDFQIRNAAPGRSLLWHGDSGTESSLCDSVGVTKSAISLGSLGMYLPPAMHAAPATPSPSPPRFAGAPGTRLTPCWVNPWAPPSLKTDLLRAEDTRAALQAVYGSTRSTEAVVRRGGPLGLDPNHVPGVTRFVCNPVTRELSRLPDSIFNPVQDLVLGSHMGFITQADRGDGPPDSFAAAKMPVGRKRNRNLMIRFLSETGEWEFVEVSPAPTPLERSMEIEQEPLAFGGRLWWVDLAWGAVSADPFSDRPEISFVQLPRRSVMPPVQGPISYRRVGVSQGRLRYVELSQEQPFLLSSFVLDDDEGSSWTLEHRVVLNKIWGRSMSIPLQNTAGDTEIVLIHPLDSNVVYLRLVATSQTVVVDMDREEVIETCLCSSNPFSTPCLLPPWLGSTRIPSASGKKDVDKNKTMAGVLVRSDNHY